MKSAFVCTVVIAAGLVSSAFAQELVSVRNDPAYPVRLAIESSTSVPGAAAQSTLTLQFENTSDKPIIAFAVGYRRVGEPDAVKPQRALTFFAAAKDRMIEPGAIRQFPQPGARPPEARIEGTVDLVVFADGSAIGANRLGDARLVQARLLAQRTALKELLTRIQNRAPNPVIQKMVQDELDAFPTVVKKKQPGGEEEVAQARR
jgi:hypothetical protein